MKDQVVNVRLNTYRKNDHMKHNHTIHQPSVQQAITYVQCVYLVSL